MVVVPVPGPSTLNDALLCRLARDPNPTGCLAGILGDLQPPHVQVLLDLRFLLRLVFLLDLRFLLRLVFLLDLLFILDLRFLLRLLFLLDLWFLLRLLFLLDLWFLLCLLLQIVVPEKYSGPPPTPSSDDDLGVLLSAGTNTLFAHNAATLTHLATLRRQLIL